MFRSTRRLLATALVVPFAMCAFSGGAGDPIINSYDGTAVDATSLSIGDFEMPDSTGVGITGKLSVIGTWHDDLLVLRSSLKGAFGCPIAP